MAPRFLTKNQPVNGATGYPNKKGMKDGKVTIAEIGPRLKLIRQELGITQKQLAQDLDMNQAILSKFENGGMVYASVLLDVLCYFRDRININYLLQPGDDQSPGYRSRQSSSICFGGTPKDFWGIQSKVRGNHQQHYRLL